MVMGEIVRSVQIEYVGQNRNYLAPFFYFRS